MADAIAYLELAEDLNEEFMPLLSPTSKGLDLARHCRDIKTFLEAYNRQWTLQEAHRCPKQALRQDTTHWQRAVLVTACLGFLTIGVAAGRKGW
mmetsp:Transcript_3283/g.7690  ORF Transcript_3283/g.7690 Transcript_3283/m.7690 type:complete len:94 (+) Transcript_3283:89-370(+)